MIKRSEPIFAVRDVRATITFYRDVLGGGGEWLWEDPPTFGGLRLGQTQLMFCLQPDLAGKVAGHQHQFFTDAIDELHDCHARAGAPIISPIENKPWGVREYTVLDPNGYHLRFGGPPKYERPAGALETLPASIRIEPRLPTWDEYRDLHLAAGWGETKTVPAVLARSWFGCVAIDGETDATVGMTRVMHDSHAWYSIWDVVVRPEYQAKRVGTAMMETALSHLRQHAGPGALVFLFTHKPQFYERLGFRTETCSLMQL
jgi:GNAT superfamily N-acetyltransferase/predicted enzyme related to lactoylglutathione lyase